MIKLYNVKLYGAKIKKSIDFNLKSKTYISVLIK